MPCGMLPAALVTRERHADHSMGPVVVKSNGYGRLDAPRRSGGGRGGVGVAAGRARGRRHVPDIDGVETPPADLRIQVSGRSVLSPGSRAGPGSGWGGEASTWSSTRSAGSAHG